MNCSAQANKPCYAHVTPIDSRKHNINTHCKECEKSLEAPPVKRGCSQLHRARLQIVDEPRRQEAPSRKALKLSSDLRMPNQHWTTARFWIRTYLRLQPKTLA